MSLIKVTPQLIEDHATAIRSTVASIESHQQAVTRIVQNPALQMAGLNDGSIQEAHQSLNAAVGTLNGNHTQLANAFVTHSNTTTELDSSLARQVH